MIISFNLYRIKKSEPPLTELRFSINPYLILYPYLLESRVQILQLG